MNGCFFKILSHIDLLSISPLRQLKQAKITSTCNHYEFWEKIDVLDEVLLSIIVDYYTINSKRSYINFFYNVLGVIEKFDKFGKFEHLHGTLCPIKMHKVAKKISFLNG